jgi:hypothetical protein
MPSHKVLKGIVRSFVESFASSMNYSEDDYVMGHIVEAARRTGATELRVNILTGQLSSSPLAVRPVKASIERRVSYFPQFVAGSSSSMEFITAAEMVITVDPTKNRPVPGSKYLESPFTCTLSIVDDRGKVYSYTLSDWWYPET